MDGSGPHFHSHDPLPAGVSKNVSSLLTTSNCPLKSSGISTGLPAMGEPGSLEYFYRIGAKKGVISPLEVEATGQDLIPVSDPILHQAKDAGLQFKAVMRDRHRHSPGDI